MNIPSWLTLLQYSWINCVYALPLIILTFIYHYYHTYIISSTFIFLDPFSITLQYHYHLTLDTKFYKVRTEMRIKSFYFFCYINNPKKQQHNVKETKSKHISCFFSVIVEDIFSCFTLRSVFTIKFS